MQTQALSWVDKQLSIVFDFAANLLNSTLVIACADHGESFGENGRFGHVYPDPQVMRVPMWAGLIRGKKWS
jgi:glucan phosphoethanolaminetransferase (alkaline phosphatase superfamily)